MTTTYKTTETELLEAYRQSNPKSRAVGILKYVRNGASVRQMGCVLCGEVGPTWCGNWPKTVGARAWEFDHRKKHLEAGE